MEQLIIQLIVSYSEEGIVKLSNSNLSKRNLNIGSLFCSLTLPKDSTKSLALVKEAELGGSSQLLSGFIILQSSRNISTTSADFANYCQNLTPNMAVLHFDGQEWLFAAKNNQLDTNGLVTIADALRLSYKNENLPDELLDVLFANKDYPLRVYETQEYTEESEDLHLIEPFYTDHPSDLKYEDNYVCDIPHLSADGGTK